MCDYVFKAFIINRADYESTKPYSGEWLHFPTDAETVKRTFEKIGLPENASPDTYFFDDYIYKNGDMETDFPRKATVDELHYLSSLLGKMDSKERNTFNAVIEAKEHTANITSIINLAHNVNCYSLVYGIYSWENVGAYIAEQQGFGTETIGTLSDYIDYAAYGKHHAENSGSHFLDDVYLERVSTDFKLVYDGRAENIPQEYKIKSDNEKSLENIGDYVFKAFIVNRADYNSGNKETNGAWLYLPTDTETVKKTFEKIGLPETARPDKYLFKDYACGNDDLKKCFSMYESIDALNYLAECITGLEDIEMITFQAVLEAGECKNVTDVINLAHNTECYEVMADIDDYDDLGRQLLLDENIVLGGLCTYFDLEAYAQDIESEGGGKMLNGRFLKFGCAEFKKVYDDIIEHIPSEYRVTPAYIPTEITEKKTSIKKQLAAMRIRAKTPTHSPRQKNNDLEV